VVLIIKQKLISFYTALCLLPVRRENFFLGAARIVSKCNEMAETLDPEKLKWILYHVSEAPAGPLDDVFELM